MTHVLLTHLISRNKWPKPSRCSKSSPCVKTNPSDPLKLTRTHQAKRRQIPLIIQLQVAEISPEAPGWDDPSLPSRNQHDNTLAGSFHLVTLWTRPLLCTHPEAFRCERPHFHEVKGVCGSLGGFQEKKKKKTAACGPEAATSRRVSLFLGPQWCRKIERVKYILLPLKSSILFFSFRRKNISRRVLQLDRHALFFFPFL